MPETETNVHDQPVKVAEVIGPKVEQLPIDDVLRLTEQFGDFIVNRPDFSDQKINEFIMQSTVTKEKFDDVVNKFIGGGYKYIKELQNVSPDQIEKGMKVEMEHINPTDQYARPKSLRITIDHLKEDAKYYDKLEKVEGKAASVEVNAERTIESVRWMASLSNVEREISPTTQKPSFKATWEKYDETLPIEAVVIDTTPNANKWQIDNDELVNLAMHIGEISLHINHSKDNTRDVVGKFTSGKVDGNKLIAKAIVLDRETAKSVFYGTLHDVSMSGKPKKAICSGCGASTLYKWDCGCKDAVEKVSGMKWDEGSIVTDGAYESAKIRGVGDEVSFTASMNRWAASKKAADGEIDWKKMIEAKCAELEKKLEGLCGKKAEDEKKDEKKEEVKEAVKEEVKEEIKEKVEDKKDDKKDEKKEDEKDEKDAMKEDGSIPTVPVFPPNPEVNHGEPKHIHISSAPATPALPVSVAPPVDAAKAPETPAEPIKEASKTVEAVVIPSVPEPAVEASVEVKEPIRHARMDDDIEEQKAKNRGAGRIADPHDGININNGPTNFHDAYEQSRKTGRVSYVVV